MYNKKVILRTLFSYPAPVFFEREKKTSSPTLAHIYRTECCRKEEPFAAQEMVGLFSPPENIRKVNLMNQWKRWLLALGCALCAAVLVLDGEQAAAGPLEGVQLCLKTVIPSLFCFMVLTSFLINSGLYQLLSLPLGPLSKGLFCLPPSMGSVVLLSLVGGYPMGAKSLASLLEQHRIDRATAQRMLPFCCCAGPTFILTAVGAGMFGSTQAGMMLLGVQLGVSVLLGICLGLRERTSRRRMLCDSAPTPLPAPAMPLSEAFVLSVSQTVSALAQMCGFVVLFKVIANLLAARLGSGMLPCFVLGSLEVTNGCLLAAQQPLGLVLASCFLSFGGLSVAAQIAGILRGSGVALSPFLLLRLVHAACSGAIVFLLLRLFPQSAMVFSGSAQPVPVADANTPILSICLVMMSALLLMQTASVGAHGWKRVRGQTK